MDIPYIFLIYSQYISYIFCVFSLGSFLIHAVNSLAPCVVVTASTDRTVRVFDYSYHRALHTRRFDGYGSSREAGPVLCCAALEPPTVCADNGKAYFAAGDLGGRTQVWVLNREDSMKTGNVRTFAHTTA